MTVSYTAEVTSGSGIGCFLKLLKRWRGSIYKLVWFDLIIFLGIYYVLNICYHYLLNDELKTSFDRVVSYCDKYSNLIPLSFVLGFFINIVYTRWWSQFTSIPLPDNVAILIGASIKGQDEKSRLFKRTIVRYVCVSFTMTLALISPKIKKRFPTLLHFVDSGLLSEEEVKIIEEIDNEYPSHSKSWLPLAWASIVTTRAREEGVIKDDHSMIAILEYLDEFRSKCSTLLNYDWISIPLVYTQVVTLAVYGYFLIKIIGCQNVSTNSSGTFGDILLYSFPLMPVVEFFFYMGWLKVAEALINPFGTDDDDFETSWFIDRNVQVCYLLVDRVHQNLPKLIKDAYWEEIAPQTLPFTVASQNYVSEHPEYSTNNINVKTSDQEMVMPELVSEVDSPHNRHRQRFQFGRQNRKNIRFRKGTPLKKIITSSSEHLNQPLSENDPQEHVESENSGEKSN